MCYGVEKKCFIVEKDRERQLAARRVFILTICVIGIREISGEFRVISVSVTKVSKRVI